ncbi:histidine kinase [Pseudoroseomonas rhizosphaerae]|uniref:histidine kinase n=1 Tax=Teichococcus rhizosphaerae TaxID=1335062 RepID=A0A2C7AEF8_9PROT|nr:response regulator [Pseudoroseomonas rhizosphaerae]PHK96459.1 histidine kinase [Pseudoroseomonas rhizosphaerae]
MRLRRRLPVLFLAVTLLTVSMGVLLTVHVNARLRENRQAVWQSFRIAEAARVLLSDMQEAETGQHGFVLTERGSYLAPYEVALARIPQSLAQLAALVADNPAQRAQVRALEELIGVKLRELARSVAAAREHGAAAGRAMLHTETGREATRSIHALVNTLLADQSQTLSEHIAEANREEDSNVLLALIGFAVALTVILGGAVVLIYGNGRLRRAEAAVAQKSAVLQATLDNIHDGVVAFDARGILAACNRRLFDLLGFPHALARPGTPLSAFLAIDRRREQPVLAAPGAAPGPGGGSQHMTLLHAGAELEIYRNPMPDGGFVVSCIDVTRRAQAEAILRQSQKMEAIGQLTGGVAHDFNNLLQVITANLDLLGREIGEAEKPRRHLRNALSGAERGARLTAQLLAFARRQPLDPKVVNAGRLVQEMIDLLRRTLGERVAVEAVVEEGLWNTRIDPSQVENALLNLAINARDAMPEGGRLTIEVTNAFLDETGPGGHLEVEPGQYVVLAVSDTGVGMPPEVMARVFEPFFTTKPEGHGTGLGLSQVYGFVKQSGGHVRIYSEPGQGTTVKLYLPRSLQAEETIGGPPAGPVVGGSETILVVEDDAEVRNAVVDMLREMGYRVLRAEDAEAALTVLSSGVRVDLLFTDVVMPGPLRARELARRAQAMLPGLKVLFTSGYTADAMIHHGKLDTGVQLLSKPYRRDDLARQVRRLLDAPGPATASAPPAEVPAVRAAPAAPPAFPPGGQLGSVQEDEGRWPEGSVALIVEDDPLIRMNLAQMTEILGFQPAEAERAEKALAWLRDNPAPAVMLTDLTLPGMDGIALAVEARRIHPRLPVLLVTGHSEAAVTVPPELRPGPGFLGKPFAMLQLEKALLALWRQGVTQ